MLQEINLADFSPQVRTVAIEALPAAPLLTLGVRSYLVNATAHFFTTDAHILVGRYSSLGHWLDFYLGMNHDYHCVTTYPMSTVFGGSTAAHESSADSCNQHQILIGSDVWIGGDVTIMSGVHIGNGAVIGAGAVVAKDVPPYAVVVGNPMRIVKYRFDEETVARLLRIKWWNWPQEEIEHYLPQFKDDMSGFLDRFDVPEETEEGDETADVIRSLRTQGYMVSYFIPDFEIQVPYAVWSRVIDKFLAAYTAEDKAALVLAMPDVDGVDAYAEGIAARMAEMGERAPLILSHQCSDTMPFSIAALRSSNVYITTREPVCSYAVDYAADAGLTIRYGGDHGSLVFPPL